MNHKYGEFPNSQVNSTVKMLRKDIFFLLLCVDPKTKQEYKNINVQKTFQNIMYKISGLNDLLFCPPSLVIVLSLLQEALIEYENPDFSFQVYRKLILDAGSEIMKLIGDDYAKS